MKTKFERVSLLPPYVFAEINDIKAKERLKGRDVIDLGMGNPDNSTPKHIVDKLIETIKNGKTHRYSVSKGILGLRKAHCNYYKRRFGTNIILTRDTTSIISKYPSKFKSPEFKYSWLFKIIFTRFITSITLIKASSLISPKDELLKQVNLHSS